MADPSARIVTLPTRAWVAASVVLVAFLTIFAAQLVLIAEQRGLIDQQRKIAAVQATRARPILRSLDALLGGSPAPAVAAAHRAGVKLASLQDLLGRVRRADLVRVAAVALPDLVDATRSAVRLLGSVAPSVHRSLAVQEQSLAIQQEALAEQRRVVSLAQQTLAVAQATLSHTESIDRKTGGQP